MELRATTACSKHAIVVLWFGIPRTKPEEFHYISQGGYNPYTIENHSTADSYYDATD